jgi:phosphotransferase system enzyme I (PtsI)
MKELRGIAVSPGVASAPAFVLIEEDDAGVPDYALSAGELDAEWSRLGVAAEKARLEVTVLRDKALAEAGQDQAAIFDAHLLMLADPDYLETMEARLRTSLRNVERVILELERELVDKFSRLEDPYLRARAADVRDISRRLIGHLLLRERLNLADLSFDVVLVAHDLLPSDMISMNRSRVKAIVTEAGGPTSHVAILARAFEIPAVLGVGAGLGYVKMGATVAVDGDAGLVTVNPDPATLEKVAASRRAGQARERQLALLRDLPARTRDGRLVLLKANIEVPEEAVPARAHGADGVGLFRSEFLFLKPGGPPGEEEQYRAYRRVVEAFEGRSVTIRSLDIGGDKILPDHGLEGEKNPLLGWRAIRFCLANEELFLAQLRAILRAAVHGDARIMFPMISTRDELARATSLLERAKEELRRQGKPYAEDIPAGIMIEVPAAALAADILARSADFFSIGTNDLIQYTMAVDRGNERVAYLHEPFNPGVLRLIRGTIEAGRAGGIPVGMCGEMAADPAAALLLLGLGLEEFSMTSFSIPLVKRLVRSSTMAEANEIAQRVMEMGEAREASAFLAARAAEIIARPED